MISASSTIRSYLVWNDPTDDLTAPVLAVALERFPSKELAQCPAYLEKCVHHAAGDSVSVPTRTVSVSGNRGTMVAFTDTVSFASEFGEKVPRPETRHTACIPTPVPNIDLTIDLQAAEDQAGLANAVFQHVLSGTSLAIAGRGQPP